MKNINQCKWELLRDIATLLLQMDPGDRIVLEIERHSSNENVNLFDGEITYVTNPSITTFPTGPARAANDMKQAYMAQYHPEFATDPTPKFSIDFCDNCGNAHRPNYLCPACKQA